MVPKILNNNSTIFYVYEWFVVDTLEIFYVGKGKNLRRFEIKDRNQLFKNIINKHRCSVRILKSHLTEKDAFELELDRISELKVIGQARANLHVGGYGGDTFKYRSKEENKITSEKISRKQTGKRYSKETNMKKANRMYGEKNGMFGKKRTEQQKKDQSEKMSGDKNCMYQKSVQYFWYLNLTEEEAKKKELEWKNKISESTSAENNPMYGNFKYKELNEGNILGIFKDIIKSESIEFIKNKYNVKEKAIFHVKNNVSKGIFIKEYIKNNPNDNFVIKYLILKDKIKNNKKIEPDFNDIANLISYGFSIRGINRYYNTVSRYAITEYVNKIIKGD